MLEGHEQYKEETSFFGRLEIAKFEGFFNLLVEADILVAASHGI